LTAAQKHLPQPQLSSKAGVKSQVAHVARGLALAPQEDHLEDHVWIQTIVLHLYGPPQLPQFYFFPPPASARKIPKASSKAQREIESQSQQDRADSRPVTSRDRFPEDQQPPASPAERPSAPGRAPTRRTPAAPVPANLVIPPGTVIFARLAEPLSSDRNQPGDTFTATLDRPVIVDGWVVARRGQTIVGSVTTAQKAGRVKGVSQLGLELTDLTIVDGQQLPILTELWKGSAGTSHGSDAAGIATATGAGTILGAAADGGAGAGIGAGARVRPRASPWSCSRAANRPFWRRKRRSAFA